MRRYVPLFEDLDKDTLKIEKMDDGRYAVVNGIGTILIISSYIKVDDDGFAIIKDDGTGYYYCINIKVARTYVKLMDNIKFYKEIYKLPKESRYSYIGITAYNTYGLIYIEDGCEPTFSLEIRIYNKPTLNDAYLIQYVEDGGATLVYKNTFEPVYNDFIFSKYDITDLNCGDLAAYIEIPDKEDKDTCTRYIIDKDCNIIFEGGKNDLNCIVREDKFVWISFNKRSMLLNSNGDVIANDVYCYDTPYNWLLVFTMENNYNILKLDGTFYFDEWAVDYALDDQKNAYTFTFKNGKEITINSSILTINN